MLTIVTDLKVFRIPLAAIEKRFSCKEPSGRFIYLPRGYATCIELLAAVNGEPFTKSRVDRFLLNHFSYGCASDGWREHFTFTIVCDDGEYDTRLNKHTLARHSLLIRGFIEEYPEATSIRLPALVEDVRVALSCLTVIHEALNDGVVYAMQLLTPVTDLYYLLFPLQDMSPSFITSLLERVTAEERRDLLQVHRARRAIESGQIGVWATDTMPDVPEGGDCLAIGYTLPRVLAYVEDHSLPGLTEKHPSFIFLISLLRGGDPLKRKNFLLTSKFDDDSGVLEDVFVQHITRSLIDTMSLCDWNECKIVLAMLGIKGEALGNVGMETYAPYQLICDKKIIRDNLETMRSSLMEKAPPSLNVEALLHQHCR